MLSWVSTMLAISLASLLAFSCLALKSSYACCCTRKYASECSRDFRSPSLLVTAQLIDVFQLVVETQETKLIQTVSSNSLCQQQWPVTQTLHQDKTLGLSHYLQDSLPQLFYQLCWRPTRMCHYPEPYLHYFLYHFLIRHSSPIFCQHSKRRNKQTHNKFSMYQYMKLILVNDFISKVDRIKLPSLLLPSTST